MKRVVEVGVFLVVIVSTLMYGVFRYYRLGGLSEVLVVTNVLVMLLPLYYLIRSRQLSHYTFTLVSFCALPVGMVFTLNHFPGANILHIIGVFGYFSAGVQLLMVQKRVKINIGSKAFLFILAIVSLFIVLKLFFQGQFDDDIEYYLQLAILITSGYLIVFHWKKDTQWLNLTKVLFLYALLPVCVWVVEYLLRY